MTKTAIHGKTRAAHFERLADALQKQIDHKRANRLTNTPKRQVEAARARIDADDLERGQRALRLLAGLWGRDECPTLLQDFTSRAAICALVYKGYSPVSYYAVAARDEYVNKTEAGLLLQSMLEKSVDPTARANDLDRRRKYEIRARVDEAKLMNIPGYFRTPAAIASQMIELAGARDGHRVLEPSAGDGAIVQEVVDELPNCQITAVERVGKLADILALRFHGNANVLVCCEDFMAHVDAQWGQFERVLMNPPFERNQDAEHVVRAYTALRPGGVLVAVVSAACQFAQRYENFRAWIEHRGGQFIKLPEGSFKESGTLAGAMLLRVTR